MCSPPRARCAVWLARLDGAVVTTSGQVLASLGNKQNADGVTMHAASGTAQAEARSMRRAHAHRHALVLVDDWASNFQHFHLELLPKLLYFHALRAALRLGPAGDDAAHLDAANLTIVTTLRAPWAKQAFEIAGAPYLELTEDQEFATVWLGQHLGVSPRSLHASAVSFLDYYKSSARRLAVACERDTCPSTGELALTRLGTRGLMLPPAYQSSITVRRRVHGAIITAAEHERIACYFSRQDATDDGGHGVKLSRCLSRALTLLPALASHRICTLSPSCLCALVCCRRILRAEPELIARLSAVGLPPRTFSELSLVERVSFLRGVRMGAMLYGAGLANLLYTGRSTTLVVICDVWAATEPSNREYFSQLASSLGVSLEFMNAGRGARPEDPNASGGFARRARLMQPFLIDVNATVDALAKRRTELMGPSPTADTRRLGEVGTVRAGMKRAAARQLAESTEDETPDELKARAKPVGNLLAVEKNPGDWTAHHNLEPCTLRAVSPPHPSMISEPGDETRAAMFFSVPSYSVVFRSRIGIIGLNTCGVASVDIAPDKTPLDQFTLHTEPHKLACAELTAGHQPAYLMPMEQLSSGCRKFGDSHMGTRLISGSHPQLGVELYSTGGPICPPVAQASAVPERRSSLTVVVRCDETKRKPRLLNVSLENACDLRVEIYGKLGCARHAPTVRVAKRRGDTT